MVVCLLPRFMSRVVTLAPQAGHLWYSMWSIVFQSKNLLIHVQQIPNFKNGINLTFNKNCYIIFSVTHTHTPRSYSERKRAHIHKLELLIDDPSLLHCFYSFVMFYLVLFVSDLAYCLQPNTLIIPGDYWTMAK